MKKMKLDIRALIEDLGGVAVVAAATGYHEKSPYQWIRTGQMHLGVIEKLKSAYPDLVIDDYFEEAVG